MIAKSRLADAKYLIKLLTPLGLSSLLIALFVMLPTRSGMAANEVTVTPFGNQTTEAGSVVTVTLVLSKAPNSAVWMEIGSSDVTEGIVLSAIVTFTQLDWNIPQIITVTGQDDTLDDGDQPYTIIISDTVSLDHQFDGAVVDDVYLTNLDNDGPTINIGDNTVDEGDSGQTNASFQVSLTAPSPDIVQVNYATTANTATPGEDYLDLSGTITFSAGTISQFINVPVLGDLLDEPDQETFFIDLSAPINSSLGDSHGIGTISDNDPLPTISILDTSINEGDTGTGIISFTVQLNPISNRTVNVIATTVAGSATFPDDFEDKTETLVFNSGDSTKTFTVLVNGDYIDEGDSEIFYVDLSQATNATIMDGHAIGTINDDDIGGIALNPEGTLVTSERGERAELTVALTSRPKNDVTLDIVSSDLTEGKVITPTLTFTPQRWNVPQSIIVEGLPDGTTPGLDDGDIIYSILITVTSSDSHFDGKSLSVPAINLDTDERLYLPALSNSKKASSVPTFEDNFSSDQGWNLQTSGNDSAGISGGRYWLKQELSNFNTLSIAPAGIQASPYSVRVHAKNDAGSDNSLRYGILFDWIDANRFYRFLVDPANNIYELHKRVSTGWETLLSGAIPGSIDEYNAWLMLERDKLGIRVYMDGILLGETIDASYTEGEVGLIVNAPSNWSNSSYVEASFDDFSITPLTYNFRSEFSTSGIETTWSIVAGGAFQHEIYAGEYYLKQATDQEYNVLSISPLSGENLPYYLEVDARLSAGAQTDSRYGLIFEYLDVNHFYRFLIDPSIGRFYLYKRTMNGWEILIENSLPASFSASGEQLQIRRSNDAISLYIDGYFVDSAPENEYHNGQAGLVVVAPKVLNPGQYAEAAFDNFEIGKLY